MKEHKNSKQAIRLPIYISVAIVTGILIGAQMTSPQGVASAKTLSKFKQVLSYIQNDYVDEVDTEALIEHAINDMMEELDPHTNYINAKDNAIMRSQLEGNFEGIGIEFNIFKDTIYVIVPISSGPSVKAGLLSGDKIIKVNGETVAGVGISNKDVINRLRGEKGSKVKVAIKRNDRSGLLTFEIERDVIPQYSVDVAYMADKKTGYIKVSRFSATTYTEFKQALINLKEKGMERMILDLTGNPGGYLDRAVDMVDEILKDKKLIVYTEGKESKYNDEHFSKSGGGFENGSVIIMIDEGSASAAEIVTGALQDHDRGLVVGRRSFGKGLVQLPINLNDGSELRLTISHYYTPSGRSIQKPYDNLDDYHNEFAKRYESGELFNKDSVEVNDKLIFKTASGRTVYGGGGIIPDFYVPVDSTQNLFLNQVFKTNTLTQFSLKYYDENKEKLNQMGLEKFMSEFEIDQNVLASFKRSAQNNKISLDDPSYKKSIKKLKLYIKAFIGRSAWNNEGFFPIFNQTDPIYLKALDLFDEADQLLQATNQP